MSARHHEFHADWRRTMAAPLTQRDDAPRRPHPRALHVARQHNRRRNQYTPIVERGWFLALFGVVAVGLLWSSAQGLLP